MQKRHGDQYKNRRLRPKTNLFWIALALSCTLQVTQASAQEGKDWQISAGLGVMYGPFFRGSEDANVLPLPIVEAVYRDRFFASSTRGLGAFLYKDGESGLGVSFAAGPIRFEDLDEDLLFDLDEVDPGPSINLFLSEKLGPLTFSVNASRYFGDANGYIIVPSVSSTVSPSPRLHLTGTIRGEWYSDSVADTLYGVSFEEAARRTENRIDSPNLIALEEFKAEAGMKEVSGTLSAVYIVNPKWSAFASGGYFQLLGDVEDSPLTPKDGGPTIAIGAMYTF